MFSLLAVSAVSNGDSWLGPAVTFFLMAIYFFPVTTPKWDRSLMESKMEPAAATSDRASRLRRFGANVRRERVLRLITQEKLARLAGLNVRTIARIEAGELNLRRLTIERIRQAIGCPRHKLLYTSETDRGRG